MINLLLGSGLHNGKLPFVNQITKEILDLPADENDDLYPEEDRMKREEIRNKFRKILKLIYDRIKYYFKNLNIEPNYEDIFYILNQIIEDVHGNKYNPIIDDFRTNLFKKYGFKKDIFESDKVFEEIRILLELQDLNLMSEIKRILRKCLYNDNYTKDDMIDNLFLLKEIICYTSKHQNKLVNIFSLNHDIIFEKFFRYNNIDFCDGFNKIPRQLYECRSYVKGHEFDSNYFRESINVNLLKLHGSLDWYHCNEKGPFDLEGPLHDFIYRQSEDSRNLDEEDYSSIVIGTYNKTESYLDYIYIDLFSFFNENLNKSNLLICSGYGFQDSGINRYIIYWMSKNKNSKLLIINPNINSLVKKERRELFLFGNFTKLKKEGRILTIENKFSDVKLDTRISESGQTIEGLIEVHC